MLKNDTNGFYFVVDRIKNMFISGGENVYPAEVEKILEKHPSIETVIVLSKKDERWGEVGHGCVVLSDELSKAELKFWCREKKASYKIPKSWSFLDSLPLLANGKIDREGILGQIVRC